MTRPVVSQTYLDTKSPVGRLRLVAESNILIAVLWEDDPVGRVRLNSEMEPCDFNENHVLAVAKQQVDEYFAGERNAFQRPN